MTTPQATGSPATRLRWAATDAWVLIGRTLRHIARSPEQLMLMLFLPLALLLMFRYLFGGAIAVGATTYVNYVVPGIFTVSIAFNATMTSVAVCNDMVEGIVERFRSMPTHAAAVLVGHVVAALVRNLVSVTVMILAGVAVGFRPAAGILDWIAVLGLLMLFATAISWIAVIIGLLARTVEGASGLTMPLVFIPYISSAFVPTATMPDVLRVVAENQPVTLVIDAVRDLFIGTAVGGSAWLAVLWWVAVTALAAPLASLLFRRKAARRE